jgi:hypothetical protein
MVTLKVGLGVEEHAFNVHKKLLCEKIDYFKMFEGPWKEAGASVATFPEDKKEPFDLLIVWVYTGSIRYTF